MKRGLLFLLLGFAAPLAAAPPATVASVDLARYVGTWYEVARLPNPFQKHCACTSATYALLPDGRVSVLNRCRTPEGRLKEARGKAWVVDRRTNARLKVRFFWPFSGDYWILALDPDYRHVLVGTPNRRYLWILSRTPGLPEATVQALLATARAQGFDTTKVLRTPACGEGQP
jgi:apolipoprotein D and lipocalin family protein